jgi:hypothetical protein
VFIVRFQFHTAGSKKFQPSGMYSRVVPLRNPTFQTHRTNDAYSTHVWNDCVRNCAALQPRRFVIYELFIDRLYVSNRCLNSNT